MPVTQIIDDPRMPPADDTVNLKVDRMEILKPWKSGKLEVQIVMGWWMVQIRGVPDFMEKFRVILGEPAVNFQGCKMKEFMPTHS